MLTTITAIFAAERRSKRRDLWRSAIGYRFGLTASLLIAASAAAAQPFAAPLPPALPWHGASEALITRPDDPWITPAEAADFDRTPSYAQTRAYLDRVAAVSPLIRTFVFGHTAQGREMIAVLVGKDGKLDPKKPTLLVQAGIHAGEIDGKDAGLMLLRDIARHDKAGLVDKVNFVFVPIFNIDGHERSDPYNRPNQRGPDNQGWRTTAQNLNLNRDYLKAETPEMRAMLGLIGRVHPDLYLDLHVTDGADYQYDITFGFNGWNGRDVRSPRIGAWLDRTYRPAVTDALTRAGHTPGPLVLGIDDRDPDKGNTEYHATARFSNGYADLARFGGVLVEMHSLKPYKQRVLGTYVLLEATLVAMAAHGAELHAAVASDRNVRPTAIVAAWTPDPKPLRTDPWLGIAHDRYVSPASGAPEVRWLGRAQRQTMPVYGDTPGARIALPKAWWVPATAPWAIERLRLHGVTFEKIAAPRTIVVEMLRAVGPKLASAVDEGHVAVTADGFSRAMRSETFPAGSIRVPADQPLGELAAMLLEPQSPEGLFAWGYFPAILQRTEYIEGYAIAPLAERMLGNDPALKAEFEAKLKADPAFAADPQARLTWFYARTPYYDDRYLLYPIGREL